MDEEHNFRTVMVNLGVLSKIKAGDKLGSARGDYFQVQRQESYVSTMYRLLFQDSRRHTHDSIIRLYAMADRLLELDGQGSFSLTVFQRTELLRRLEESLEGLAGLRSTYKDDLTFIEQLNLLELSIKNIKIKHPNVKNE